MCEYEDFPQKDMTRAKRRKTDYKKAVRKKRITEEIYNSGEYGGYFNNLHQFSKNKIHCSCPMCRAKTNQKKLKGNGYGKRGIGTFNMWSVPPKYEVTENGVEIIFSGTVNKEMYSSFGFTKGRKNKNWKFSDIKKVEKMDSEMAEYI